MKTKSVEQHYSPDEAAQLLSVERTTVYRAMARWQRTDGREGIGPTVKLGHATRRIPASALQRYLEGRRA